MPYRQFANVEGVGNIGNPSAGLLDITWAPVLRATNAPSACFASIAGTPAADIAREVEGLQAPRVAVEMQLLVA